MPKYIDAFGKVKINGESHDRSRLIQFRDSSLTFALFPESDPHTPELVLAASQPRLSGRRLVIDLADGGKLEFERASCGCQTPSSLRGPQSQFLARIPAPVEP